MTVGVIQCLNSDDVFGISPTLTVNSRSFVLCSKKSYSTPIMSCISGWAFGHSMRAVRKNNPSCEFCAIFNVIINSNHIIMGSELKENLLKIMCFLCENHIFCALSEKYYKILFLFPFDVVINQLLFLNHLDRGCQGVYVCF